MMTNSSRTLNAGASYIVSRDEHLLSLGEYKGITILSLRFFFSFKERSIIIFEKIKSKRQSGEISPSVFKWIGITQRLKNL